MDREKKKIKSVVLCTFLWIAGCGTKNPVTLHTLPEAVKYCPSDGPCVSKDTCLTMFDDYIADPTFQKFRSLDDCMRSDIQGWKYYYNTHRGFLERQYKANN